MKKIDLSVFKSRRFKHGTMATVMTVLFVVAVIIVNIIVNMVLDRFPASVDLTYSKIYELTEDSQEYIKNLDTEVKITVCYPESDMLNLTAGGQPYGKQTYELLKDYQQLNSKIKVEYVDLMKNPEVQKQYTDYNVTTYSIIVESDKRVKVITLEDFIEVSQTSSGQSYYFSSAEKGLTSAIMYTADDTLSKAVVLKGHGEMDSTGINSLLTDNNYEVVEQNITTEDIDKEANIAILAAPSTDYTDAELKKLDAFLDNDGKFGKTLIYVGDYSQKELPKLDSFLDEWGIKFNEGVVVETDAKNIYDRIGFVYAADLVAEDYTKDLRDNTLPVLVNRPRPIETTFTEDGNRKTEVLMSSKETSVIVPTDEEKAENFDINKAEKSSQNLAVLGSRTKYDGSTTLTSNVVAFSSLGMFNEQYTSDASLNNNEYTVNLINKLSGKQDNINISSVSFNAEKLQNLTLEKYNVIRFIFVILVPLVTLILSVVVFVRRRNR